MCVIEDLHNDSYKRLMKSYSKKCHICFGSLLLTVISLNMTAVYQEYKVL